MDGLERYIRRLEATIAEAKKKLSRNRVKFLAALERITELERENAQLRDRLTGGGFWD